MLTPEIALAIGGIVVNAAVTWGVLSTKLDFLRRDVDHAHRRLDVLSNRVALHGGDGKPICECK